MEGLVQLSLNPPAGVVPGNCVSRSLGRALDEHSGANPRVWVWVWVCLLTLSREDQSFCHLPTASLAFTS